MADCSETEPAGGISSTGRARRREWALLWLALSALAVVRAGTPQERDPYWQVRAGLENLSGQALARPDSWSWAPAEGLFTQTSPAWNTVLGLGWRIGGFAGFFVLTLLSVVAYFAVVIGIARRLGCRPLPTLLAVLVVAMLALPMLSPRATLVAQTLFMAALLAVDRWRTAPRPGSVAAVATATLLGGFLVAWAGIWLHLSWLLLAPALWLAFVGMLIASPSIPSTTRVVAGVAAIVGLSVGLLAGPYGTQTWAISRKVQSSSHGVVLEWLSPFTSALWPRWWIPALVGVVGAGAAVVWVFRHWHQRAGDPRVGLVIGLLVLAAPAAVGGLIAIRFVGVALLTLAPMAAMVATRLAEGVARRADAASPHGVFRNERIRLWSNGEPWRVVLTLVLVVLLPLVALSGARLGRPAAEANAIETLPSNCRLLSDPGSAALAILLRPDVSVWFDTRADYYGKERNAQAIEVLSTANASHPVVERATCVVLADSSAVALGPLAASLDSSQEWVRTFDESGVTAWSRRG